MIGHPAPHIDAIHIFHGRFRRGEFPRPFALGHLQTLMQEGARGYLVEKDVIAFLHQDVSHLLRFFARFERANAHAVVVPEGTIASRDVDAQTRASCSGSTISWHARYRDGADLHLIHHRIVGTAEREAPPRRR